MRYPLVCSKVAAGFPSPAENYIEKQLSLDELLIEQPAATFFVRVSGSSMQGAGIFENDILVVNRALVAKEKDIVIAVVAGEFTVKTLSLKQGTWLLPQNPDYPRIQLKANTDDYIWGVVCGVVRKIR